MNGWITYIYMYNVHIRNTHFNDDTFELFNVCSCELFWIVKVERRIVIIEKKINNNIDPLNVK